MSNRPKLSPLQKHIMILMACEAVMRCNNIPKTFFDKPNELYQTETNDYGQPMHDEPLNKG